MSAKEIKSLAQQAAADEISNKVASRYGMAERCSKYETTLLAYAAMVERCEKMLKPCRLEDATCVPSDDGYCDSCDVPKYNEMINYILRGDAEKEKR